MKAKGLLLILAFLLPGISFAEQAFVLIGGERSDLRGPENISVVIASSEAEAYKQNNWLTRAGAKWSRLDDGKLTEGWYLVGYNHLWASDRMRSVPDRVKRERSNNSDGIGATFVGAYKDLEDVFARGFSELAGAGQFFNVIIGNSQNSDAQWHLGYSDQNGRAKGEWTQRTYSVSDNGKWQEIARRIKTVYTPTVDREPPFIIHVSPTHPALSSASNRASGKSAESSSGEPGQLTTAGSISTTATASGTESGRAALEKPPAEPASRSQSLTSSNQVASSETKTSPPAGGSTQVASISAAPTVPAQVEGFHFVKTVGAISEYGLDVNGLQVLLMPEHSAPVLTFMVTYRVGARNEVTGTTGATHLLEHMMFKGTDKFLRSKGTGLDQLLEQKGAVYNATTWLDRTNYYENLGSDSLALAVEIESDRMRNLLLREEDRRPEMTVVRNEFELGENNPFNALSKEIYAGAFVAHPYHHSTIGWRSDIEKVPIEKLREFYNTFYWPDNATVSVIGDFQPADALGLIKKFYGPIPRAPKPFPPMYTEEPEQSAPRRVGVKRAGQLGVVAIGHKIPAVTHPDYAALTVLSTLLTEGKNSRLYRALTDKNLTTSVQASIGFNHDPSLHITYAALAPGAKHEDVEKIVLDEIERIKKDGVTPIEVQTAINQLLADSAFQRDGSFAIAGNLNECIAVGDWTTYYTLDDKTKTVTADDVKRVANTYLIEDHSTTGWFIPIIAGGDAPAGNKIAPPPKASRSAELSDGPNYYRDPANFDELHAGDASPAAPEAEGASGPNVPSVSIAAHVQREKIDGIDTLIYPTGAKDVVTLRGSLPAGDSASPAENVAIATLAGMLLDKGTTTEDKFAIAQKLDSVGATLQFRVGNDTLSFSAKCLRKDVPLVISLIAEQLRNPAFAEEEFAKVKKQYAGNLKRSLESTDFRASELFSRAVYPVGNPNRQPPTEEMLAAANAATLDQVKAFHQGRYGPQGLIIVVVGDLDPAQTKEAIAKNFAGWTGGAPIVRAPKANPPDVPKEQTLFMPDKTSVSVTIGQASGLKYSDPDYFAVRVGTAILGSGFTGRLMANVRDKEGLTYDVRSLLSNDSFNEGDWKITAGFAPALLEKGLASTKRQLTAWYEQGVTPDEVAKRKSNLVGTFKVALATTGGIASQLLATIERGYDPSFLDEYPAKINALTPEQVNTAIKKHLKPDSMIMIEAGTIPNLAPSVK